MLVLSRKENESIVIDGNITITVVKIGGDRIRLGIEAPQDVPILRSELIGAAAKSVVIGPFVVPGTAEPIALAH
jgi:carbon storage regulator